MDTFVDYYNLLHVRSSAPAAVIKASYRTMLQKLNHHPDRGGDAAFAQLLNAAATTLCNPRAREHYDQLRRQQLELAKNPKATEHRNRHSASREHPGGTPDKTRHADPDNGTHATNSAFEATATSRRNSHSDEAYGEFKSLPATAQCPFCLSPYPTSQIDNPAAKSYLDTNRCLTCNAARTPIAKLSLSHNDELRQIHRQQHDTSARVWPFWPIPAPVTAILTDFSPAGCALLHSDALDPDDVIVVETALFNAVCLVRHCKRTRMNQYAIGLEFITLDMLARPGTILEASV